jgi:hypothetical protein
VGRIVRIESHRPFQKRRSGWPVVAGHPLATQGQTINYLLLLMAEIEQVHQVGDGGAVQRNIRVTAAGDGVREVVAAAG